MHITIMVLYIYIIFITYKSLCKNGPRLETAGISQRQDHGCYENVHAARQMIQCSRFGSDLAVSSKLEHGFLSFRKSLIPIRIKNKLNKLCANYFLESKCWLEQIR